MQGNDSKLCVDKTKQDQVAPLMTHRVKQQKQGRIKLRNALNPKQVDLES